MATPRLSAAFFPLSLVLLPAVLSAQMAPDVRVSNGRPAGAATAAEPSLAGGGAAVYAAWTDGRNGPDSVWCNTSVDGGRTWSTDQRLDHGTGPARAVRIAALRTTPTVVAVWLDARNGGQDVYCNRSLDGGATWLAADVRLNTGSASGAGAAVDVRLALSSSSVYVVWTDLRNGGGDVYANASHDSGATWLATDVKINGGNGTANNADVAAADPFVHVVWNDTRNGAADVYFAHSANSGSAWLPEVRVNAGVAAGGAAASAPRLAISQQHVYVGWTDARNAPVPGNPGDVFLVASHDSGTTFPASATQLNTPSGSLANVGCTGLQLAATGSAVFAVWADARTSAAHRDIYANSSANSGTSWRGDVRLDLGDAAGASDSSAPQIAASGSAIDVVWADARLGAARVFANRSPDAGASWFAGDIRLDTAAGGSAGAAAPQVALSNSSVYVAWSDDRSGTAGTGDVFYTLANGYQPYGTGTPGQFGGIPILTGAGQMVAGASGSLNVSNGPGGALGVLVVGFGPGAQIAQPLVGGTLLVQPVVTIGITLSGPTGIPGIGARNTAIAIPAGPGFLGQNLDFQGLFLDSGAVQGVSMSNAVAAWIG